MEQCTCQDVKALLSAVLDDELDEVKRHRVEIHLAECTECAALLDEAEATDLLAGDLFESGNEDSFPVALENRIWSAISEKTSTTLSLANPADAGRSRRLRISAWAGWTVAAAAVVVLAFQLFYYGQELNGDGSRDGTQMAGKNGAGGDTNRDNDGLENRTASSNTGNTSRNSNNEDGLTGALDRDRNNRARPVSVDPNSSEYYSDGWELIRLENVPEYLLAINLSYPFDSTLDDFLLPLGYEAGGSSTNSPPAAHQATQTVPRRLQDDGPNPSLRAAYEIGTLFAALRKGMEADIIIAVPENRRMVVPHTDVLPGPSETHEFGAEGRGAGKDDEPQRFDPDSLTEDTMSDVQSTGAPPSPRRIQTGLPRTRSRPGIISIMHRFF
jgi:hypothetical protein